MRSIALAFVSNGPRTFCFNRNHLPRDLNDWRCLENYAVTSRSTKLYLSTIPTAVDTGSNNITQQQQQQQQQQKRLLSSTFSDTSSNVLPTSDVETWLDLTLPEGRCVGVRAIRGDESFPPDLGEYNEAERMDDGEFMKLLSEDHWMRVCFHPEEIRYGATLRQSRTSFWLGRLALRIALGFPDYPILRDSFGRPQFSSSDLVRGDGASTSMVGSISHKQDRGVALVSSTTLSSASSDNDDNLILAGVGVDLELTSRPEGKQSIAKRVLTESERTTLGNLSGVSEEEEILLRFSLKEAIYKAAHPILCQYVGFQEAEVTPKSDGTATCRWMLSNGSDERIAKLTAHWYRLPLPSGDGSAAASGYSDSSEFFLTTASVFTSITRRSL
ncbi:phosphopantetheinyl transferase [Nitzschia inconspicua]|uniref:Phosphopantetheinyl transferase n=1 Tax=Nitzschia inconspicua TaxID=303405 RepID=A0A9K3KHN5_9STRA|nr:phosphopantetheinyl transferase [Nitzschia inconspicua]